MISIIMSIETRRPDSADKEPTHNEYTIVYPNGGEALVELNPDKLGDVVYLIGGPNATKAEMLSSDDVIKGVADHQTGTITWEDGKVTEGSSDTDVVFARGEKNVLSERKIIPEILIGKVDKEANTISFSEPPENYKTPHTLIRGILNGLYEDLWSDDPLKRDEKNKRFETDEKRIADILNTALGVTNLSVQLDSDDALELYEGDWNSPPIVVVSRDGTEIDRFEGYDEDAVKKFILKHKQR